MFDEIDTPTEKERAEIRELNSRTDMNYINAGVVSPEEVRGVLREDEESGYNTLSEEMEGEPLENDPFADMLGGGENSTNFFNSDEWEESKHPRKENGQFGEGGSGKVEKSQRSDKIRKRTRKEVLLPKDEYARIMSELNTNLSKEVRKKKHITRFIGNSVYRIENNGFNNYKITGKYEIDT